MRTRMYGGVRGRKTKVGGKPTFVFLLLDWKNPDLSVCYSFVKMYTATVGRMTNSSRVISTKA
jgi:hypothetical protein